MKKIMLFASALAGLFLAASCQRENLEPQQMAGAVKFTVEAPGAIATKTIADGQNVDVVHYAVYKTNSNETHAIEVPTERPLAQGFVEMSGKKANINFNLLQDQKYTVIFWAQVSQDDNGQNDYYELGDLRAISMKKDAENNIVGNEEARAAFFAWYSFETYEHKDHVVTLKRPFAQLNLLTTLESLTPKQTGETTGYTIDIEKSTVTVEGLTSTFYPYAQPVLEGTQGKAEETNETFTFTLEATPAVQGIGEGQDGDLLNVNGKAYHYVSMNYFFVPVDEYNVNLTYGIKTDKGSIENSVVSVPVKKNFRTNVIGNLLTKESKFEIIVDERFEGDNNLLLWDGKEVKEPAYDDATKTYFITEPAELAWFAQAVNGGDKFAGKTVKLMNDIYLDNSMWTPIGAGDKKFEGTFDGQDNTIFDLNVTTEGTDPAGLFGRVQSGYVKNVKVVNARVQGHASAAVVVAHGVCAKIDNCHVENAVVVSTPYNKNDANNVGGIVGFLGADGGPAWVKDCTVKNADITAYRKVGGVVGSANQATVVTGNKATDVNVTADHTYEYSEAKPIDLGEIAGYVHTQATVENNTAENVDLIHKVDTVDKLNNAAEDTFVSLADGEYNLTDDVNVGDYAIEVNGAEAVVNGQGHTITGGSDGNYAIITKGEVGSLTMNADLVANGGGYAVTDGSNLTIAGGTVHVQTPYNGGGRYCLYLEGEGSVATINDGTFSFDISKSTRRAYIYAGAGTTVYVKGGTFGKPSTRSDYKAGIMGKGTVIVTGGTFGFDPTKWVAAGYTAKKEGQNWVVVSVTADNLSQLVATPGSTVKVAAGEYKFPSSNIAEGVTIECAPGTVFTGNSKLNIKGATVIGATFSNPSGTAVDQTINGTFKNCTFEGANALRWCYAGETVVFENCVFSGSTYGVHFDSGANDILFKNCTFSGFNAFGAAVTMITFDGCTFVANGKSGYNGANLWGSAKMIDTEFIFDGNATYQWVDCLGADKTYEFTGCTINNGNFLNKTYVSAAGVIKVDGNDYDLNNSTFISTAEELFAFANEVNVNNNAFNGKTVYLMADIDLANAAWTPVGQTGATQFKGTFDGQGKTIYNLNIDATAQTGANCSSGLFGWLNAATVKNVNIAGATVKGNHNVGVIAGYLETAGCTIEACQVTGAAVECHVANSDANGDKCGVIVGHAGNAGVVVKDCTAANSTVTAGRDAGQIAGAAKEANVTGCSATNVTVTANGEGTGANIRNEVIGRIL